jgi:MFS superfamily sulfate permease-like transporter
MAGIIAALATAAVALFFTPLFFNLPEAALGAIVIVAVSGMFKPQEFRRLYWLRRQEFWLALITFLAVLTFEEVLVGLLIGVLFSLLALIARASSPKMSILGRLPGTIAYRSTTYYPDAIQKPGLLIVRADEGIFFANAASLRNALRSQITASDPPIRATIFDMGMTDELDVPSTEMLATVHEELEEMKIQLKIAVLHQPVRDMLEATGLLEQIGPENIYPTVLEAALAFTAEHLEDLDPDDIDTVIHRINTLSETLTFVFEDASEEQQAKLDVVIDQLEDIRIHIEPNKAEEEHIHEVIQEEHEEE